MKREEYVNIINNRLKDNDKAKNTLLNQIEAYYKALNEYKSKQSKYKVGDRVFLEKGTLMHGTYKNIMGLKHIVKNGLISSWFVSGRKSKYPSSVGVWNLNKDYYLDDYINFYSGGTFGYYENKLTNVCISEVVPYSELSNLSNIINRIKEKEYHMWLFEQTKESRFLPSLVQDSIQIGIIFNGNNEYIELLKKGDVLSSDNFNDEDVEPFVNPGYYERFLTDRKNMNDFFTDRESAILFGIPSVFIEGILVGREYEKDSEKLDQIKQLLPNVYICNLDGRVIVE